MVNCGIPQGSILGHLLFNLCIHNLTPYKLAERIPLKADDTILIYSSKTYKDMQRNVQNNLIHISEQNNEKINYMVNNYLIAKSHNIKFSFNNIF